jgi:hypothetical protein
LAWRSKTPRRATRAKYALFKQLWGTASAKHHPYSALNMPGETNLPQLLRNMHPVRQPGTYVFCTIDSLAGIHLNDLIGSIREAEGVTVILPQAVADRLHLPYSFVAAWITLTVHSALEAVGLTAAFAQALAQADVSCNVVAGYYHDHIFVPLPDGDKAVQVLEQLANSEA